MRPEKEVLGGEVTGQYPDQINRAIAMSAFEARIAAVIRVGLTLLGILSMPVATPAGAQPAKIHRVGFLASGGSTASANLVQSLHDGLRELGWIEHKNFVIDYRFAEGRFERLPKLADELIRSNVDLVLAATTPAAVAARNATSTIPVVMASVADSARHIASSEPGPRIVEC